MHSILSRSKLAVVVLAASACGGGEAPVDADAIAIDTTIITNIPREPLTEGDLMGMELVNLSVELPWTENRVSRDPGPAATSDSVSALPPLVSRSRRDSAGSLDRTVRRSWLTWKGSPGRWRRVTLREPAVNA